MEGKCTVKLHLHCKMIIKSPFNLHFINCYLISFLKRVYIFFYKLFVVLYKIVCINTNIHEKKLQTFFICLLCFLKTGKQYKPYLIIYSIIFLDNIPSIHLRRIYILWVFLYHMIYVTYDKKWSGLTWQLYWSFIYFYPK